jgi:hypothetical protein
MRRVFAGRIDKLIGQAICDRIDERASCHDGHGTPTAGQNSPHTATVHVESTSERLQPPLWGQVPRGLPPLRPDSATRSPRSLGRLCRAGPRGEASHRAGRRPPGSMGVSRGRAERKGARPSADDELPRRHRHTLVGPPTPCAPSPTPSPFTSASTTHAAW